MALTPITSSAGYCTGAESVLYCDPRAVGDRISDDNARVDPADVPTHPVWIAALLSASGHVESACSLGKKYTPADLEALAAGGGAMGARLKQLVTMIAVGFARRRRAMAEPDDENGYLKAAEEYLERLRKGERIFGFVETERAGLPSTVRPTQDDRLRFGDFVLTQRRNFGVRHGDRGLVGGGYGTGAFNP